MIHVVTAFVRNGGELLLVRRDDDPRIDSGRWDGLSVWSSDAPADVVDAARDTVRRLVGPADVTLVRGGDSFVAPNDSPSVVPGDPPSVASDGAETTIHPVLFEGADRELDLADGIVAGRWLPPHELRDVLTVPGLPEAYRRVGPTVETVTTDTTHGSAWLSARALEVLRDRAMGADSWASVADVARQLRAGHPDMAALANRINRAMARGVGIDDGAVGIDDEDVGVDDGVVEADAGSVGDDAGTAGSPESIPDRVADTAHKTLREALLADEQAADRAAELIREAAGSDPLVASLSRSGTVFETLRRASARVLIGESRPACEGTEVATTLAAAGLEVTLTTDAALPWALDAGDGPRPDLALVGADAVLPDGAVLNKVGTRALGLSASRADVPLYVVAARDKVAVADRSPTARSDPGPLAPGPDVETWTPTFDRTPADCLTGIITEGGVVTPGEVSGIAAVHRRDAAWEAVFD